MTAKEIQEDDRRSTAEHDLVRTNAAPEREKIKEPQVSNKSIQSRLHSSSLITNLSDALLSESETMVLEKGLNFSTVEQKADKISLLDDTYKFSRKLKLRAHFDVADDANVSPTNEVDEGEANQVDDAPERSDMSMKMKNPYYNPPGNSPKALDLYITAIKSSIQQLFKSKKGVKDNLSEDERISLDNLRNREDIVIQQADKGKNSHNEQRRLRQCMRRIAER